MAPNHARRFRKRIAVTGGAGFIGSNLLLYMVPRYPEHLFVNIDCLTYAANLSNLKAIENAENYRFEKIDIRQFEPLKSCFERHQIDAVIHLAAESHVDRSIIGPSDFIFTNVIGTFNLLELARVAASSGKPFRFYHVSTDEVFGSAADNEHFRENSPYHPSSPYSASKAAADHLVAAYHRTYGLDTVITNCSNNYGPYQFPEKLIPLTIRNAKAGLPIPIYGDGRQVRDWLYVEDHCRGIDLAFHNARPGSTYNFGGGQPIENIELVKLVLRQLSRYCSGPNLEELITYVEDRPGHDRRYAVDFALATKDLGWRPTVPLEEGLAKTVRWYLDNDNWLQACISGEYLHYYEKNYAGRKSGLAS